MYLNIHEFVSRREHGAMLRNLLAEVVDYTQLLSEEFFASNLLQMLESFIDRDPPRSLIVPLLPALALAKMDEMQQILEERHDAQMERLDTMFY